MSVYVQFLTLGLLTTFDLSDSICCNLTHTCVFRCEWVCVCVCAGTEACGCPWIRVCGSVCASVCVSLDEFVCECVCLQVRPCSGCVFVCVDMSIHLCASGYVYLSG